MLFLAFLWPVLDLMTKNPSLKTGKDLNRSYKYE